MFIKVFFIFFLFFVSSCVYRFPLEERKEVKTYGGLYVEPSLNPKGFLLGTHLFDKALQQHFIRLFPHLKLVSREKAGFYMRVTHNDLSSKLLGDERLSKGKIAGVNDYRNEKGEPLNPFALQNIKAKEYYVTTHEVNVLLTVELWNLYTHEKIFVKNYSFKNQSPFLFHPRSHLLEMASFEKSLLLESSDLIATTLVSDLLTVF